MLIQPRKEGLSGLQIKRIVQKIHRGFAWQLPRHGIGIDAHDVSPPGLIPEPLNVVHGDGVQRRRIFDADYSRKREVRRQQKQFALSRPDVDEKIFIQIDIKGPDCVKKLLAPEWTIDVIALECLNVGNALRIKIALLMSVRSVTPIVNFIFETLPAPSQAK